MPKGRARFPGSVLSPSLLATLALTPVGGTASGRRKSLTLRVKIPTP